MQSFLLFLVDIFVERFHGEVEQACSDYHINHIPYRAAQHNLVERLEQQSQRPEGERQPHPLCLEANISIIGKDESRHIPHQRVVAVWHVGQAEEKQDGQKEV